MGRWLDGRRSFSSTVAQASTACFDDAGQVCAAQKLRSAGDQGGGKPEPVK
jgi:hypothetical protein